MKNNTAVQPARAEMASGSMDLTVRGHQMVR